MDELPDDEMTSKVTRREVLRSAVGVVGATGAVGAAGVLWGGCGDDGGSDAGTDSAVPMDTGSADSTPPGDASLDATDATDAADAADDAGPPADFQLPAGHFVPAKMPMEIVAPRPMAERTARDAYGSAHEGVRYEMPVGVVGGAWPFFYELVDAPAGMTIGAQLVADRDALVRPEDYGVVRYTPPAGSDGGTFSYTVRVTDQEGSTATVAVTVTVDNARFVFVAPDDGSASGSGSIDAPLRGFAALYRDLASDDTYAGRLVYFRDGAYTLTGGGDANNNVRLGGAVKPKVLRAYPGERPVFDCATAKITFNGTGSMDDVCIAGLTFENGRQDVANAHFIWANAYFDRGLFFRNHFNGLERGTSGNDNPAAIFLSATRTHRRHVVVMSNVFEAMGPGGGNGVAGYDSYAIDYGLFEDNAAVRCQSSYCLWLKGGHRFTTVRGERLVEDNQTGTVLLNIMLGRDGGTERSESVEVSYCRAYSPSGDSFRYTWASTAGETGPLWIYRCTVRGALRALHSDTVDVTLERCVVTTETLPMGSTTTIDDIATVPASDLDETLSLIGPSRFGFLGTHGADVAS